LAGALAAAGVLLGATLITSAHAGRAVAAGAPTYGGSYSIRFSTAPDCLDPEKTAAAASSTVDGYIFSALLSIDAKGHYVGNLAQRYTVSKSGTRVTFYMHPNETFSNGDPLTAQDVKFTFDRALDPATKSPVSASQLGQVSATKVISKYTVELDLKAPFRPLLTNLAGSYTSILDRKWMQANASNTCNSPVGSGPYKIQSTGTAFDDVVLVPNKRHNFGPSWVKNHGVPWISKVEFKTIASDATAVSELLSGGIDYANVPGTQLSRVQGNTSFVIHKTPAQNLIFVEFNTAVAPFNDPQVRKAFAELIDRPNIVKAALGGLGSAVYNCLPPAIPFFDKAATKLVPTYSESKAAQIISAKHATGPYNLMIAGVPPFTTIAQILQAAAAQAGMQLNIVTKGGLGDFVSAAAKGDFNVLSLNYSYSDPDVLYYLLHSSQGHGAGLNWTNATDPTLDGLLVQGRTTLKNKTVATVYAKAQQRVDKALDFVGVADQVPLLAVRKTIKGYHTDSAGAVAIEDLYIKTK
jgi:peptide/nickel transport system substrate-binding protein